MLSSNNNNGDTTADSLLGVLEDNDKSINDDSNSSSREDNNNSIEMTNNTTSSSQNSSSTSSSSSSSSNNSSKITSGSGNGGKVLDLRVKSFREVDIRISDTSNVASVKKAVRSALGEQAQNRYLRLICKGRLLAPDSSKLREFSVQNGDVVHAVLAAVGVRGGQQAALARGTIVNVPGSGSSGSGPSRRYRSSTNIGPGGRVIRNSNNDNSGDFDYGDDSSISGSGDEEEGRSRERLGFDRLRTSPGLSRGEVATVRSYFSRHVDHFVQTHPDVVAEIAQTESDLLRRRLMQEDAWMSQQGPASEFRLNLSQSAAAAAAFGVWGGAGGRGFFIGGDPMMAGGGNNMNGGAPLFRGTSVGTDRDFLWGFLLGFFVGFLMLVWVWMPTVPHKQKLGILTGISFQLAMNFLKDTAYENGGVDEFVGDE